MSEIKIEMITKPNYGNLTMDISIRSPEKDCVIMSQGTYHAEERYVSKIDEARFAEDKECYERARIILKLAGSYLADIKLHAIKQGRLHFVFSFPSKEALAGFENDLKNINELTRNFEPETYGRKK